MDTVSVRIEFPNTESSKAGQLAENLLADIRENVDLADHLDRGKTGTDRNDPSAQDFGTILVAVLGTRAVIILAKAILSWAERTGTSDIIVNGVQVTNVRSQDVAAIVKAINK